MTNFYKWKAVKIKEIEEMDITQVAKTIFHRFYKCEYCKWNKGDDCFNRVDVEASECLEGIKAYLESKVE